ncbi:hypothetical protein BGZ63DRAFT_392863 [Mariannaea sp. PMI_226]|nr:hypothetical protein BGZ63DRAFT_392863 [Mariannaea sp. PMI_226]
MNSVLDVTELLRGTVITPNATLAGLLLFSLLSVCIYAALFKRQQRLSESVPAKDSYTVPLLVSRFSSRCHPDVQEIYGHSKQSCDQYLKEVAEKEVVSHNGAFAACGGFYCSWVYPDGDKEKVKIVSDFYSAWVFIDDLIDNSTDMSCVIDHLEGLRRRGNGKPHDHKGLDHMFRLYTQKDWNPESLQLTKAEFELWRHTTLKLRLIEAEKRQVSVEEYLTYRQTNSAMGMMYVVMNYTHPDLAEDFVRFNEMDPETINRYFSYCGISVGIVLDLYKLNADHAQVCEYMHIAKIIQFSSHTPMSLPEAVDKSVVMFHEYEDKLAVELGRIAAFSPKLAKAMEEVHGGSIKWLEIMRGRRYTKK